MLKLAKSEPEWLELAAAAGDEPAVEVRFAPIGVKAVRAARRAAAKALGIDEDDVEEAGDAMSRELIRRGILEWRGIGDDAGQVIEPTHDVEVKDDDGEVIEVVPGTISAFLADPRTFEAADRLYVYPWVRRDQEKNVSSASPNGTGEAATPGADIASSAATEGEAPAAETAPTPAKSRKPRKARAAGK